MDDSRFVVNASPLILLAAADALFLLPRLAEEVLIPKAVVSEVLAGKIPHPDLASLASQAWVRIEPDAPVPAEVTGWDLGAGETQVLALSIELGGIEVVLDDLQARRCSRTLGLPTTGTLWFGAAGKATPIDSCREALRRKATRKPPLPRSRSRRSRSG